MFPWFVTVLLFLPYPPLVQFILIDGPVGHPIIVPLDARDENGLIPEGSPPPFKTAPKEDIKGYMVVEDGLLHFKPLKVSLPHPLLSISLPLYRNVLNLLHAVLQALSLNSSLIRISSLRMKDRRLSPFSLPISLLLPFSYPMRRRSIQLQVQRSRRSLDTDSPYLAISRYSPPLTSINPSIHRFYPIRERASSLESVLPRHNHSVLISKHSSLIRTRSLIIDL